MGPRYWAKQLTGNTFFIEWFLLNGLHARNLFVEIVWTVKITAYMANYKGNRQILHIFLASVQ